MPYKRIAGVYKIESPSGKIYIGQSRSIHSRWSEHKYLSNKKKNMSVYSSIAKYGFEAHKFSILHQLPNDISSDTLTLYEQFYMDIYIECGFVLLNTAPAAGSTKGMTGKVASIETRERQSIARKGRKMPPRTDAHRLAMSIAKRGNKGCVGRILSDASKLKIANSLKGHIPWNKGKANVYSDETREKISSTLKKRAIQIKLSSYGVQSEQ